MDVRVAVRGVGRPLQSTEVVDSSDDAEWKSKWRPKWKQKRGSERCTVPRREAGVRVQDGASTRAAGARKALLGSSVTSCTVPWIGRQIGRRVGWR